MIRKAFTLIELLVVIAIIAILAAILFPVFAQAKSAAKKTACLSNLKNIATAIYLYTADYEDKMCQTSWESVATPQPFNTKPYQIHWTYLMQPYIKSYDIFKCPSDQKVVTPKNPCPNGIRLAMRHETLPTALRMAGRGRRHERLRRNRSRGEPRRGQGPG